MHFRQALLSVDHKQYVLTPNRPNSFDAFYVDFQVRDEAGGWRYSVFIHPKQDLTIDQLELQFNLPLPDQARWMANGFQSWSESRSQPLTQSLPPLRAIARPFMGHYGDAFISGIPRGKGYLHSWTYTWTDAGYFAGSLNEKTGFTLFIYDQPNGVLTVRKDMAGLLLRHSFPALDVWLRPVKNADAAVFQEYFRLMECPPPKVSNTLGWTSWYRYFNKISADIILHNADALQRSGLPFEWCQIDDGWQTHTGDWLSVKETFPKGMEEMARQIKLKGLRPGLWIAPFVVSGRSRIFSQHPDWLLKDTRGKPLRAGWNPYWGGWFYALDFYHPQVRDHLSGVFHVILDRWGFELLKVDFLFAVCLATPPEKTRGQVMYEAMEFLRKLVGNRSLLVCGVPLGAAFGQADYCRIGSDVHVRWEHRILAFLHHRERVSTLASLRSTIHRWQLSGTAFGSDSDVFILRQEQQHLSLAQQQTLLTINALLGDVLFTSDDVSHYTDEQKSELEGALMLQQARVSQVDEVASDVFRIRFNLPDCPYPESAWCNLTADKKTLQTSQGALELLPFETMILKENG